MKKKFIAFGVVAVMLMVALLAVFAMPIIAPDVDVGLAGGAAAETADLAIMNSEAVLIVDNTSIPASAATAGEMSMWIALGASLVTIAVVCRRRVHKISNLTIMNLRRILGSTNEGARSGGGPNKFILPASA